MSTNIYPDQTRSIDPFSEYSSNMVSQLTRMITQGNNCLFSPNSVDVEIDTTSSSTNIIIKSGKLFKDDILISIDEDFSVDMTDSAFYISTSSGVWNEAGYYYIVANYQYYKSLPAPKLSIGILKPSQQDLLTNSYLFLKAVYVIFNGISFEISDVYDYDPNDTSIKRIYTPTFINKESTLPDYNPNTDNGKLIYVEEDSDLYFGNNSEFEQLGLVKDIIDTTNCEIGQIAYIGNDKKCYPAIADSTSTIGICVILSKGLESDRTGKIQLAGKVDNISVETGITINIGDHLYLSTIEAGTVTNIKPNIVQHVGQSLTSSTITISALLLFSYSVN